ncbi:MAG TPA: hypothetical protein VF658_00015 [Pyrinomonadaceae bacterium]|jgi:hypothetical protein
MTKNRTVIFGSLLLLILAGAILALSKMNDGVAKSSPAPRPSTSEALKEPSQQAANTASESKPQEDIEASLEQEWEKFTTTEFCFLGSDDYRPGRGGDEKSFSPYGWLPSAKKNLDTAIAFLIERIPSQKRTKAHVCPLDDATEGELAVYSLQHLLRKNWYELNEEYKGLYAGKPEDVTDQDLLRSIIENKEKSSEMMNEWKRQYSDVVRLHPG